MSRFTPYLNRAMEAGNTRLADALRKLHKREHPQEEEDEEPEKAKPKAKAKK